MHSQHFFSCCCCCCLIGVPWDEGCFALKKRLFRKEEEENCILSLFAINNPNCPINSDPNSWGLESRVDHGENLQLTV